MGLACSLGLPAAREAVSGVSPLQPSSLRKRATVNPRHRYPLAPRDLHTEFDHALRLALNTVKKLTRGVACVRAQGCVAEVLPSRVVRERCTRKDGLEGRDYKARSLSFPTTNMFSAAVPCAVFSRTLNATVKSVSAWFRSDRLSTTNGCTCRNSAALCSVVLKGT